MNLTPTDMSAVIGALRAQAIDASRRKNETNCKRYMDIAKAMSSELTKRLRSEGAPNIFEDQIKDQRWPHDKMVYVNTMIACVCLYQSLQFAIKQFCAKYDIDIYVGDRVNELTDVISDMLIVLLGEGFELKHEIIIEELKSILRGFETEKE